MAAMGVAAAAQAARIHAVTRPTPPAYHAAMVKTTFGKTGFSVTQIGFGAAPVAFLRSERDRAASVIHLLLDAGVNLIDTAAAYPGSHAFLGETIMHRRDDFILVDKCGNKADGVEGEPWSAGFIARSVDKALERMKTDRIDVMLLHSCDLATLKNGEALGALIDARDAGKIAFIGYSGDNEAAAYAAELPDIAVIETSVNIADQANIDSVLPLARKNNVGIIAKRPVANAAWKDIAQQKGLYKSYAKTYTDRLAAMKLKPAEVGVPGPDEQAWPEMALRFTLSQPGVHCAIIGTTNPDNARQNLQLAAKGPLPTLALSAIREAFKQADPDGQWLGQT